MGKELKELMQIKIINEDVNLSKLIEDIMPVKENKFTDLELEANKNEEFSLVIYKKENPVLKFFKKLKFSFEKFKIMKHSMEFQPEKIKNK